MNNLFTAKNAQMQRQNKINTDANTGFTWNTKTTQQNKNKHKNRALKSIIFTCYALGAVATTALQAQAQPNQSGSVTSQSARFNSLIGKFQNTPLEEGDRRYIRSNAFSPQGKEALRQYRIAVALMKSKPASDPWSWDVQSAIHGTFWTSLQTLKDGMIDQGYFNDPKTDLNLSSQEIRAAAKKRANKAFSNWNVIINNCNHWAQLWRAAKGENSEQTTPNISVVFQAWHRLYLSAFEKNVRQILIDEKAKPNSPYQKELASTKVESWALPYWDYRDPKTGSLPEEFAKQTTKTGQTNSLYEPLRSNTVNNGVSVQEIPLPNVDLTLLSAKQLPGKNPNSRNFSVGNFYNASVVLQQSQTSFASFNSLSELAPHAVGHDIIGGLADTQESKLELWLGMIELARKSNMPNFWSSDESPAELQKILKGKSLYEFAKDPNNREVFLSKIAPTAIPTVFGPNASIGPTLMGWVPTAARDPIFWLHHAYVDKMWSEYNSMRSGSFLDEGTLDNAGWNFTFWEPDSNGKPILRTYSTWMNATYLPKNKENITPNKVLRRAYYPTYTYDYIRPLDINFKAINDKPNKFLALLESPNISPTLSNITNQKGGSSLAKPLSDLAFVPINIEVPISAGTINQIGSNQSETDDIRTSIEINIENPMYSGENIGIMVGDIKFLESNAGAIRSYWDSWTEGAGLGGRDGNFTPNISLTLKGLGGESIKGDKATRLLGVMSMPRFNPLAMSNQKMNMKGHKMNTHYTTELTPAISDQFKIARGIAIKDSSRLGIMFLSSTPNSKENHNTYIKKISTSLHQNLKTNIPSDGFDGMQLITENPSLLNNEDAVADLETWYDNNRKNEPKPTFLNRALRMSYVYLASNPDLIKKYKDQPLESLNHYLTKGLREGRSLDSWTRSTMADLNIKLSIEDQAKAYVLSY